MPNLIKPTKVVREPDGSWRHPDLPNFPDGAALVCEHWRQQQGLEVVGTPLDGNADPEVAARFFAANDPDFSYWQPQPPAGRGWFPLAMHNTASGPICWWARRAA